jgi:hypothetical protein
LTSQNTGTRIVPLAITIQPYELYLPLISNN